MIYDILDDIEKIDLNSLSKSQTKLLCAEIRDFLIQNVSKTGGHLSSNLGIVELTLALHKVFKSDSDRFIFDVGHQSYVHKILTGRKGNFPTLRKKNGMSGFTKPSESLHDAFISGHASNSISVGLGMAHANALLKNNSRVISIIGDGALSGGLAFEALNNVGESKLPQIIILNDNEMSINTNVGAMTKHLSNLRISDTYLDTKNRVHELLSKNKSSEKLEHFLHNSKQKLKSVLLNPSIFEHIGITYIGPIDGHNVELMCEVLTRVKTLNKPVLIHVLTKKGLGYEYSEKSPDIYHGVSPFNPETGITPSINSSNFSSNFGDTLVKLSATNNKICAITAAMSSGTGLTHFQKSYPKRFFDVGIAEGHAVTMAGGLASAGFTPVCAIYSTFLQRSFDNIIHDVALMNLHVVFAIDRAGIVGDDGETHNGVFDVPMLLPVPNMTIFAPSNYLEQENMLKIAINSMNSPVSVRYPRGKQGKFVQNTSNSDYKIYNENGVITLITYGILMNNVHNFLENKNIKIIKINRLTMDLDEIIDNCSDKIIFIEDSVNNGSLGQKLACKLAEKCIKTKYLKLLNFGDDFVKQATVEEVYHDYNLSTSGIQKHIEEAMEIE